MRLLLPVQGRYYMKRILRQSLSSARKMELVID